MDTVLLGSLLEKTELIIQFTMKSNDNEKTYEFPTKIEHRNSDALLLSPIMINNTYLNLENGIPGGINLIWLKEKDKPVIWRRVRFVKVKFNGKLYYAVNKTFKGVAFNRRAGVRVSIGRSCDITFDENEAPHKGIIRDLSIHGFAITCQENEPKSHSKIRVAFNDENFNYHIILSGEIVRTEEIGHVKLYGCAFNKKYKGLSEYINLKQREELVRHSMFGLSKIDYTNYKRTRKSIY